MGIATYRMSDLKHIDGFLEFHERVRGERAWRKVAEAPNIVLNQFYVDLFNLLDNVSPGSISFTVGALALGIGGSPAVARTDTGLYAEWQTSVVGYLPSGGLAAGTTTTIPLNYPLAEALVSGNVLGVGTNAPVVAPAGAAIGVTTIPVNSFTAVLVAGFAPVTFVNAGILPQRMSPTVYTPNAADPPSNVISFYLAAGANSVPFQFLEAALMYNTPALTPAGAGKFLTHALFTYNKAANTDLRIDYTLQRTLT